MNETWLAHHGIKGQKWGIRRFENEDGSLTEAGKARYNKQVTKERNKELDKNRTTMSDRDLDDAINRLKKEKQLHDLTNPGRTFANSIMSNVGSKVLTTVAAGAALYGAKVFCQKVLKNQELASAVFQGGAKKK